MHGTDTKRNVTDDTIIGKGLHAESKFTLGMDWRIVELMWKEFPGQYWSEVV